MTLFTIRVWFFGKPNPIEFTCSVEKETKQIMLIRVPGSKSSLLLWTDYPLIYNSKKKKGGTWRIKEGSIDFGREKESRLFQNICNALEAAIREYLDNKKQGELPFQ